MVAASTAWVGVVGVVVGVVATSAFALMTAYLTHRWQRAASREDRTVTLLETRATILRDACARHIAAMNELLLTAVAHPPTIGVPSHNDARAAFAVIREANPTAFRELEDAEAEMSIVGGDAIGKSAAQASAALGAVFGDMVGHPDPQAVDLSAFFTGSERLIAAVRNEHFELLAGP
jgi:hypothetical protein